MTGCRWKMEVIRLDVADVLTGCRWKIEVIRLSFLVAGGRWR